MANSPATERCRHRARMRDYAKAYNAKHLHGWLLYVRGSFPNLHLRRKWPGWRRENRWTPRLSYAERKAASGYKGYAPLMDGSRMATPKWLQRKSLDARIDAALGGSP